MGADNSNLRSCVTAELARLSKQGRLYLTLQEVVQLKLPHFSWSVDPSHLAVLYALDSNKDGQFSHEECLAFLELARKRSRQYQPHEFQSQMHGYCTLQMWKDFSKPGGAAAFTQWVGLLLETCDVECKRFEQHPDVNFLHQDVVETLYHVLQVQLTQGLDFQSFLDVLQRRGEEQGLMDIDSDEYDDWVPEEVLLGFVTSVADGMQRVLETIYPSGSDPEVESPL